MFINACELYVLSIYFKLNYKSLLIVLCLLLTNYK